MSRSQSSISSSFPAAKMIINIFLRKMEQIIKMALVLIIVLIHQLLIILQLQSVNARVAKIAQIAAMVVRNAKTLTAARNAIPISSKMANDAC